MRRTRKIWFLMSELGDPAGSTVTEEAL